jgi:hypothetical protein
MLSTDPNIYLHAIQLMQSIPLVQTFTHCAAAKSVAELCERGTSSRTTETGERRTFFTDLCALFLWESWRVGGRPGRRWTDALVGWYTQCPLWHFLCFRTVFRTVSTIVRCAAVAVPTYQFKPIGSLHSHIPQGHSARPPLPIMQTAVLPLDYRGFRYSFRQPHPQ